MANSTWNQITVSGHTLALPDGSVSVPAMNFASESATGRYRIGTNNVGEAVNGVSVMDWNATRLNLPNALAVAGNSGLATVTQTGKTTNYNSLATAGFGLPVIVAYARFTAQSAANAAIVTYTVGASDGTFEVSANLNATAVTVLTTTLTVTYTDE